MVNFPASAGFFALVKKSLGKVILLFGIVGRSTYICIYKTINNKTMKTLKSIFSVCFKYLIPFEYDGENVSFAHQYSAEIDLKTVNIYKDGEKIFEEGKEATTGQITELFEMWGLI